MKALLEAGVHFGHLFFFFNDTALSVIYTYMIKTSGSSVVSAEDSSYYFSVYFGDHTGCRIPFQESFHAFF